MTVMCSLVSWDLRSMLFWFKAFVGGLVEASTEEVLEVFTKVYVKECVDSNDWYKLNLACETLIVNPILKGYCYLFKAVSTIGSRTCPSSLPSSNVEEAIKYLELATEAFTNNKDSKGLIMLNKFKQYYTNIK